MTTSFSTPATFAKTTSTEAPTRYHRVIVTRLGGPEVLELMEENLPQPRLGEVRIKVIATGLSYADLLMREGVHPETPRVPFTPGWDVVGIVDQCGSGVSGPEPGTVVVAMPITGGHAQYICLPENELTVVPPEVDPIDALCTVFNYMTAYQMMHRCAHAQRGQRVLIHAAAGGIGTALLQLGRDLDLEMYGTASEAAHQLVRSLGGIPIDYKHVDFVEEIHRLTKSGVDVVFDGIGGAHMWRSRKTLRAGGKVIVYGFTSRLKTGQLVSGGRYWFRGFGAIALAMTAALIMPGRKRVLPYSVQWLKRRKPDWFREDLCTLLELLRQQKIKPIIAEKIPLHEIRRAHELLGAGGVLGKIVLLC